MGTDRPTITTVAERARVSRQTVSNVLNFPHRVQEQTRERVQAAIDELGYRPHRAARQLRTHRSGLIAMRMAPFSDALAGSVLDRFVHAVAEAAQESGFRTLVFTCADDADEIASYEDLLNTYELDAFVLSGTHRRDGRTTWLRKRGVPFVTFGRPWGVRARHCWVDVDGRAGTVAATQRLRAAGHRRIGFVGWPEGSDVGQDRRAGWESVLRLAGIDPTPLATASLDGYDAGYASAAELVERGVTALVCASDALALGALGLARDRIARGSPPVPVIGFDDSPTAAAVGLTSVAQPLREAAEQCVRLLATSLRTTDTASDVVRRPIEHVLLDPHLVARGSG